MTKSVLLEADGLVSGERGEAYGHPLDDYEKTVGAFNALTGHKLTAEQGIIFMICVKLARECHKAKRDNRVDGPGYFKCLDMAIEERDRRASSSSA